jgi:hypothetical protein
MENGGLLGFIQVVKVIAGHGPGKKLKKPAAPAAFLPSKNTHFQRFLIARTQYFQQSIKTGNDCFNSGNGIRFILNLRQKSASLRPF